ncbi:MAG: UMP kinase [Candidatus Pacebacteria bacterium]|nr:UMP kinase [Candidatus Paceibacterota bacterium]
MTKPRFNRVMLKIGGEMLLGDREYGIDPDAAAAIAQKIKNIYTKHVQIAIVIGGGNIFRGIAGAKRGMERSTADYIGMLATVMNGLALQDALEQANIPTRLQSALRMTAVAEPFIRRKAIRHMEKGRVLILSAGTGLPYVTTDSGAALHALELNCDVLIKATKVDGVYDKDPMKYDDAKRYKTLNLKDAIEIDDIQVMDTGALAMAQENNLDLMVFKLFEQDKLEKAIDGQDVGTLLGAKLETKFA